MNAAPKWTNRPRRFRDQRPSLETLPEYASRVLRYAIVAGPYILDQEQRRLADAAAQRAQAELSAGKGNQLDGPSSLILARLNAVRHLIARLDTIERQQQPIAPRPAAAPQGGTQGGRPAPLMPPPPPQLPPAPAELRQPYQRQPAADGIRF